MKASGRHLLVQSESECQQIKKDITEGKITLEKAARKHSLCPSGARGGDLGTFSQGQMVPEFDRVIFNDELHKVHGPVQTQFGYHLLEITSRG
ncbi:peptidylprolyl isomerase [Francisella endosymbiont of Ornithodoros moubata]|uniref:peptidylprolyl isomerase n=1 Tax=Francisella-like endosymbiont TaxID=512373 RepID=UPI000A222836|nr:peptidylprolyl isomerase [Francisella endosymbiont of Ornithodoros moubata]